MLRSFTRALLYLFLTSLLSMGAWAQAASAGNAAEPAVLAELHPQQLLWRRVSPTREKPDGPVLYQLFFGAQGTPGALARFDAPKHVSDSILKDSGSAITVGSGNAFAIGSNGVITFAAGQTFPGLVSTVSAGNSFITIGGTATDPTVSFNTANGDARYLKLAGGTMSGLITFAAGQTFPGNVSSVTASGALSSSGGSTPNITLTGVVPIANGGTGSSSQSFVDVSTAQSIGGNKTFTGNATFNNTITGNISGNAGTATTATSATTAGNVTGTVAINHGGTGITAPPTIAGQYLRSSGAGTWSVDVIKVADMPNAPYLPLGGGIVTGTVFFNGSVNFNNFLNLPGGAAFSAPAADTATGKNSSTLELDASAWNTTLGGPQAQQFVWQAEPVGNNTANPSGTLNLLFAQNSPPTETGLSIAANGQIAFAQGQPSPVAAALDDAGQTTAAFLGLASPTKNAVYRVSLYAFCENAEAGKTFSAAVHFTDPFGLVQDVNATTTSGSTNVDCSTQGNFAQASATVYAKAGASNIQIKTVVPVAFTTGNFHVLAAAEQLF